jgi:hypothetical protein
MSAGGGEKWPIGTRIRFTEDVMQWATGDHPTLCYASAGQMGTVVGRSEFWDYMVARDTQPDHDFGVKRNEIELGACWTCKTERRTPAGNFDCRCERNYP